MKILINAQFYDGNHVTGIGNYCKTLIQDISKIDMGNEYFVFCKNPEFQPMSNFKFYDSVSVVDSGFKRIFWENTVIKDKMKKIKPDIFHSLNYTIPLGLSKNTVKIATVHDLNWMATPDIIGGTSLKIAKMRMKYTCDNAQMIIAISNSTKSDLIKYFNCDSSKIEVIYQGIDLKKYCIITDESRLDRVKRKYSLPDQFIFWIGSIRKNKNLFNTCKAFVKAKEEHGIKHKLVIAGSKSNDFERVKTLLDQYPEYMEYIGFVEDDDLPEIYNLSSGLVFASFYEGFGYPAVEAMACGKSVVASNISSLPELVEDKNMLADPNDIEDIASKIVYVANEKSSDPENIAKMRRRAEQFGREKTAEKTFELYGKALNLR